MSLISISDTKRAARSHLRGKVFFVFLGFIVVIAVTLVFQLAFFFGGYFLQSLLNFIFPADATSAGKFPLLLTISCLKLLSFAINLSLMVGLLTMLLQLVRGQPTNYDVIFSRFNRIFTYLWAHLLTTLYLCLWMLPLMLVGLVLNWQEISSLMTAFIPFLENNSADNARMFNLNEIHKFWFSRGFLWIAILNLIIYCYAFLRYVQTFWILADDPTIGANAAITRSKNLMRGHKVEFLWLGFSFIGWYFLCVLTLGVASIYLLPYLSMTFGEYYQRLKADYAKRTDGATIAVDANVVATQ